MLSISERDVQSNEVEIEDKKLTLMGKLNAIHSPKWSPARFAGATGLLVGSGLFVWQAYQAKPRFNSEYPQASPRRYPQVEPVHSEPEFISLPAHVSERYKLDPKEAKDELLSMLPKHLRKSWSLLRQANWGVYEKHLSAVRELANLQLSDGECCQIAQSSSMKTAIGLARCKDVNLKLFLPPPPVPDSVRDTSTVRLFQKILSELPQVEGNESIKFFTTQALENYIPGSDEDYIIDSNIELEFHHESQNFFSMPRKRFSEKNFVEFCLQALLSHSTEQVNCCAMIEQGVLPLLTKILSEHPHNPKFQSLIGKILANIAIHSCTHESIFASGWVGILAAWKQSPNLLVNLPAIKALCNMDQFFSGEIYKPGIYQLLPDNRNVKHLNELSNWGVDVVFIHGLLGGVFYSWRQQDIDNSRGWGTSNLISSDEYSYCWPRDWLAAHSDHVRVIGVDFDTSLSLWNNKISSESYKTSLKERGREILDKLQASGVGKRPVIFVGHSMGGLIVKQMLKYASQSFADEDKQLVENTKGIVFYSTPHLGSRAAKLHPYTKYLVFPTTDVQDLEFESPQLQELHQSFLDLTRSQDMEIISFGETQPTPYLGLDLTFVPTESSNPLVGKYFEIKTNHMNICKPENQKSILYRKFYKLLWDTIEEATPFE